MLSIAVLTAATAQIAPQTTDPQAAACGTPDRAGSVCLAIYRWTGDAGVARLADTVVVKPAKIALIMAVAWFAVRVVRRSVARLVRGMQADGAGRHLEALRERAPSLLAEPGEAAAARRSQRADTIASILRSTSSVVIWTIAVLMALGELGVNLGPLIAGAGILGIAVGFGAQNLVRDVVSGVFMLLEDQYGVGDVIDAGPATGTVEAIGLRTTRLRDVEGVVWHIPNGGLARVGNKSQQWSRAVLDVEVSYGTDVGRASGVIKSTADEVWQDKGELEGLVLEEPEVWGVENLGPDAVAIRLVVKTRPLEQWKVSRELRARIKTAFDEEGIEIPLPQRTVWHRADGQPPMGAGVGAGPPDGRDGAGGG